jgi:hypothetical protein
MLNRPLASFRISDGRDTSRLKRSAGIFVIVRSSQTNDLQRTSRDSIALHSMTISFGRVLPRRGTSREWETMRQRKRITSLFMITALYKGVRPITSNFSLRKLRSLIFVQYNC